MIPAETVPAAVTATGIGITNLVGEIFGATVAPVGGGMVAERYGLGAVMWMSVAGTAGVMLAALFMRETKLKTEPALVPKLVPVP